MHLTAQDVEDKKRYVFECIAKLSLKNSLQSVIASILVVGAFTWLNWDIVSRHNVHKLWVVAGFSVGFVRLLLFGLYVKKRNLFSLSGWLNAYRFTTFLSGTVYGSLPFLFFDNVSTPHQTMVIFIIVGMPAAAVGTHSVDRVAFRAFMFSILIPSMIFLFISGQHVYQMVAALLVILLLILDRSSGQTTDSFIKNFEFSYKMNYRATHDPLVGLLNRVEMENQFARIAPRTRRSIACMFIDLDNFKPLNDTLGHRAGDKALINVAQIIKRSVRSDDIAARLGGDEFVVIMFLDSQEEACKIATSILNQINSLEFGDSYSRLSASIGISFCPKADIKLATLMHSADDACYESKNAGKNKVTCVGL